MLAGEEEVLSIGSSVVRSIIQRQLSFIMQKWENTTSPPYLIIPTELLLPWEIGIYRGRLEAKLHSKSPFQKSNFRLKWFSMSFLISILITLDTKRMVCIFYLEVLNILNRWHSLSDIYLYLQQKAYSYGCHGSLIRIASRAKRSSRTSRVPSCN